MDFMSGHVRHGSSDPKPELLVRGRRDPGKTVSWSTCSQTCDDGQQQRSRTCTFSSNAPHGADCPGNAMETKTCSQGLCPADGVRAEWSMLFHIMFIHVHKWTVFGPRGAFYFTLCLYMFISGRCLGREEHSISHYVYTSDGVWAERSILFHIMFIHVHKRTVFGPSGASDGVRAEWSMLFHIMFIHVHKRTVSGPSGACYFTLCLYMFISGRCVGREEHSISHYVYTCT
ncbi:CADN-like protein [Mya arenaria]|uniref:CADN-like protein n=1 Tax=Mya arenaria TaxID=6604 RepID=A0ABY7G126_MYAAR|nr:CADN-like protein [Mya arenaria]